MFNNELAMLHEGLHAAVNTVKEQWCQPPLNALSLIHVAAIPGCKPGKVATYDLQQLAITSSYVRCILIDYSKAFDSINHPILFQKLLQLNIPQMSYCGSLTSSQAELRLFLHLDKSLVGCPSLKVSYKALALVSIYTWFMLLTCELCLHTMSSSNMLMTLPYLSVNIA